MTVQSINITLGTAGHVDHGKTALVRCFTGCETDRLKEERERGMSIELGFAPCTVADMQLGIVDVPGHEDFVKTMVAGAAGMDGVILVVAADDGVMPQTREHLDILTLLGIRHGLVALTKIDRVTADERQLAAADVAGFVQGTFLEGTPVLPLSNITGEGFDAFYEALATLVRSIRPKRADGVFRLPVERVFSVQGYGTVVAGIPLAGSARVDDEVVLLPGGLPGRIRRIEVYGHQSDVVQAGQCAAVNMGHWDHRQIRRGQTVATPGYFAESEWYTAALRMLPRDALRVKNGAEVRFHTGTTEVTAALYALEGQQVRGGQECLVQLRTRLPVVAGPGDRFIIRSLSPSQTIGGGTILEATAGRLKRKQPRICQELQEQALSLADEGRFLEHCLKHSPSLAATVAELALRAKMQPGRVKEMLAQLESRQQAITLGPGLFMHAETAAAVSTALLARIGQYHARRPESPGVPLEELRLELKARTPAPAAPQPPAEATGAQTAAAPVDMSALGKDALDGLVAWLKTRGELVVRNQRLALPRHQATFSGDDAQRLQTLEKLFLAAMFHPPGVEEVVAQTRLPAATVEKSLKILREHQMLVQVEDMCFHREAVAQARKLLVEHLRKEGRLESVQFKYLLDTTRKYALPLLDYFDRLGVTRRQGNTRHLGPAGK